MLPSPAGVSIGAGAGIPGAYSARVGSNPARPSQSGRSMNAVVIVESPAKAKTINKYLGPGYEVLASYGHVRDLPAKDGSVRPDDDFDMDWEVDGKSAKRLADIAKAVKGADKLILATDRSEEHTSELQSH